mgnify:FL=1|jgi:hypothetical protein
MEIEMDAEVIVRQGLTMPHKQICAIHHSPYSHLVHIHGPIVTDNIFRNGHYSSLFTFNRSAFTLLRATILEI